MSNAIPHIRSSVWKNAPTRAWEIPSSWSAMERMDSESASLMLVAEFFDLGFGGRP